MKPDATGSPRPFVNAKGKRRRPNSKTLAQVLNKCQDELFVDFIAKCLTWDPDRRLKPGPAMRHPWIVGGRKRTNTSSLAEKRPSSSQTVSRSYLPSSSMNGGIGSSGPSGSGSASGSGKPGSSGKQLVISPPTPLVAKAPPPLSASKIGIGHSMSSSRLTQPMSRTGSFQTRTQVSRLNPSLTHHMTEMLIQCRNKHPKMTFTRICQQSTQQQLSRPLYTYFSRQITTPCAIYRHALDGCEIHASSFFSSCGDYHLIHTTV